MARNVISFPPLIRVRDVYKVLAETSHNGFPVYLHMPTGKDEDPQEDKTPGGLILRSQLLILLSKHVYGELDNFPPVGMHPTELVHVPCGTPKCGNHISFREFVNLLTKKIPELHKLNIKPEEQDMYMDLRPCIIIYPPDMPGQKKEQPKAAECPSKRTPLDGRLRIFLFLLRFEDMNFSTVTISKWHSFTEAYDLFRHLGLRHLIVVEAKNQVVGLLTRKDFL